jgi:hypothetical protein
MDHAALNDISDVQTLHAMVVDKLHARQWHCSLRNRLAGGLQEAQRFAKYNAHQAAFNCGLVIAIKCGAG